MLRALLELEYPFLITLYTYEVTIGCFIPTNFNIINYINYSVFNQVMALWPL